MTKISLDKCNPEDTSIFPEGKQAAMELLVGVNQELGNLQDMLYAEHKNKLLIVLQAMDTGGKDGTIKTAFSGFGPQGVRVVSYKVPTAEETSHDYLWRVHKQVPASGEIVVFNRSHYEDVLSGRVHGKISEEVCERRYQHINYFERMLSDEGTTILKFFLNISKDEQKERLEERLTNPSKNWKFSTGDLSEREFWQDYMKVYSDVISKTSSSVAPWYIIPSNKNWYRNLAVASITANTLKKLKMSYPSTSIDLKGIVVN